MFSYLRRHMLVGVAVVALGFVAIGSASAATPTREVLGPFPYEFSVDCGPYGFDFAIDVQGQENVWVETFSDVAGEPVKVVIHSTFRETDANSVTGKTLPFRGLLVRTLDLVAGTRTDVGTMFLMTDPGSGIVIQDIGRVVFDASFQVAFEAGHHEVLHGGVGSHLDRLVCSALSGE